MRKNKIRKLVPLLALSLSTPRGQAHSPRRASRSVSEPSLVLGSRLGNPKKKLCAGGTTARQAHDESQRSAFSAERCHRPETRVCAQLGPAPPQKNKTKRVTCFFSRFQRAA